MSGNAYCACCTGTDLKHSRLPPSPLAILDDATFTQLATARSASVTEKYLGSATTGPTAFRVVPFGAAMTQCFRDRGLVDAEGVPAFDLKFDVQTDAWVSLPWIGTRMQWRADMGFYSCTLLHGWKISCTSCPPTTGSWPSG